MAENVKNVVRDFIALKDVANKKTIEKIKNVKENTLLPEVYPRMLRYMLRVGEKINMLVNAGEVALKEARKDKAFSVYEKSFGKSALLVYLKDDEQRIERIFKALPQNEEFRSAVLKKKSIDKMKREIDDFLSKGGFGLDEEKEKRIKKEIENLKENKFPKPVHTAVAALLFVRAIENPTSRPALKKDGAPFYICKKETTTQQAPEKKTEETGKVEAAAPAPKTEKIKDFLNYYIARINPNKEYQLFVTKQIKEYGILRKESPFARLFIIGRNLETCERNILKITNSVLEWLGKKPLQSENEINTKLLDELKNEAEKKLGKQSVLLPKKKPLLRVA